MVLKKLLEIMGEIGYLKKDMVVDMHGKGKYNAISEGKVLQMVRPRLIARGIVITPHAITRLERNGSITTVSVQYLVTDTTDDDSIIMESMGQGFSSGDKGAGSAFTYSLKYLILKALMLEQGDDPDKVGDVAHNEETVKIASLADKLKEEVGLLSQGGKVLPQQATGMVAYISKNAHDPGVLRDIENQINQIKTQ